MLWTEALLPSLGCSRLMLAPFHEAHSEHPHPRNQQEIHYLRFPLKHQNSETVFTMDTSQCDTPECPAPGMVP